MSQGGKLLVLGVVIAGLGYAGYKAFGPKPQPEVVAAPVDELDSCPNGTTECPNNCLKREAEGWRPMHVAGHPDTDIWMQFVDVQGRKVAFNQNHIGHVIEPVNGKYTDTGVCPVCKGRTRVCK